MSSFTRFIRKKNLSKPSLSRVKPKKASTIIIVMTNTGICIGDIVRVPSLVLNRITVLGRASPFQRFRNRLLRPTRLDITRRRSLLAVPVAVSHAPHARPEVQHATLRHDHRCSGVGGRMGGGFRVTCAQKFNQAVHDHRAGKTGNHLCGRDSMRTRR